jgi:hypothetical protein
MCTENIHCAQNKKQQSQSVHIVSPRKAMDHLLLSNGNFKAPYLCGYLQHGVVPQNVAELNRQNGVRIWERNKEAVPIQYRRDNEIMPEGIVDLIVHSPGNFITKFDRLRTDSLCSIMKNAVEVAQICCVDILSKTLRC